MDDGSDRIGCSFLKNIENLTLQSSILMSNDVRVFSIHREWKDRASIYDASSTYRKKEDYKEEEKDKKINNNINNK